MSSQGDLVALITGHLREARIPHMIVGSHASSFHAEPRTTRDIDIVIDPTAESLQRFVEELASEALYVNAEAAAEALERRAQFNVIDIETGWKVDLIVRKDRPFSREELARRLSVQLLGVDTHVATAEDTVIAKLEWAKAGEAERQLRDVVSILAVHEDTLDYAYLERWIRALDLVDMWERARKLHS